MVGNVNRKPIGRCSLCGGVVSIPTVWHGTNRPIPTCEDCGAVADEAANLPVVPMKPRQHIPKDDSIQPTPTGMRGVWAWSLNLEKQTDEAVHPPQQETGPNQPTAQTPTS